MTTGPCNVSVGELVDYRFGDLDQPASEELEAHLFECAACARRVEVISLLEAGLRGLSREGQLSAASTSALLRRAEELGLKLRSYRIEPGAVVQCTAAPGDDLIVVRLSLSAHDAQAVDLDTAVTFLEGGQSEQRKLADLVIDRESGELVYLFAGDYVRSIPRSRWVMHARLQTPDGERTLGPFTMVHTPWPG